jgi:hypothetical protein
MLSLDLVSKEVADEIPVGPPHARMASPRQYLDIEVRQQLTPLSHEAATSASPSGHGRGEHARF